MAPTCGSYWTKLGGAANRCKLVTTDVLAKAEIPDLPFERPDGSPIRVDTDYFGRKRNPADPFPGPFELPEGGKQTLAVWPVATTSMGVAVRS